MVTRHENIPVIWTDYLNLLEEAKKALEMNKDKFKAELLEQAEVIIIHSSQNFEPSPKFPKTPLKIRYTQPPT